MDFEKIYRKLDEREIAECSGKGTVYEHIRTGARVFTLKNTDRNKVFLIGFRTPPSDDTGVPHIMEHSVLCGSGKFPIRDPFVELAKGSLNTFLNAMTYPDKTVYPVASINDRDFCNLMDVYLDAVFHPNIYSKEEIFRQEGWHYELASENDDIIYNGVVYNEMKGAFSNPDAVLERYTLHALFPDTAYGFESGGDPAAIPQLGYEAFLDFHRKYYHPSNSYIYLYGDLDMEEKLLWIDENYLSEYEKIDIDSRILPQPCPPSPVHETRYYAIGDNEDESCHTYLSENYVIDGEMTQELSICWQLLEFLLLEAPGAPVREALIKAGIGEDIQGGFTTGILQSYFSVVAKNADADQKAEFSRIIRTEIEKLVRDGIPEKSVLAAVNYLEFKFREADFGRIPAGLNYGLTCFNSWLYDSDPYVFLYYNDALCSIRQKLGTGFLEELLRKDILENGFRADVDILPKKGLTAENDAAVRRSLEEYRASLTDTEISGLVKGTAALKAYQDAADSEEALACLPVLKVTDIDRKSEGYYSSLKDGIIHADIETNGIEYIRVLFDTSGLSERELQLISFARVLYGEMNTANYSYKDLNDEILLSTGGIDFALSVYNLDNRSYRGIFSAETAVLAGKADRGLELIAEMLLRTELNDRARIAEKLPEAKSRLRMSIDYSGHMTAVTRAGSYIKADQRYDDLTRGIACYDFLCEADRLSEDETYLETFIGELDAAAKKLFVRENIQLFIAGGNAAFEEFKSGSERFLAEFPCACGKPEHDEGAAADCGSGNAGTAAGGVKAAGILNEGLTTSTQVNYVARFGNFRNAGLEYTGALRVLKILLNYEYLWTNLRVKGGAYGCMSMFARSGNSYLVSYRDPNMHETNDVYEALPDYLENNTVSEMNLAKYIIGAISSIDQPLTPSMNAQRELSAWLVHSTAAELQKERDEVLSCTADDIKALAVYIRAILSQGIICSIGNAEKTQKDSSLFKSIREIN